MESSVCDFSSGSRDYCLLDKFNPTCKENEVILINSAVFGRMKNNPCISREIGRLGCYVDVKDIIEGFCGGRQSCNVGISDSILLATKPCGAVFDLYISVSYSCLEGRIYSPAIGYPIMIFDIYCVNIHIN